MHRMTWYFSEVIQPNSLTVLHSAAKCATPPLITSAEKLVYNGGAHKNMYRRLIANRVRLVHQRKAETRFNININIIATRMLDVQTPFAHTKKRGY